MNRSTSILVFILVLVVGLVFILLRSGKKELAWYPTYNYERGEMPYDFDVFLNLVKTDLKKDSFERLSAPFSSLKTAPKNGLYLSLQSNFYPDSLQTEALLNFVSTGNSAFICAESFGANFIDRLFYSIDGDGCYPKLGLTSHYQKSNDSCGLRIFPNQHEFQCVIYNKSMSWQPFKIINLICDRESRFQIVGTTSEGHVNAIKVPVGKGFVYVHSMPIAFTNFVMLDSLAFNYANAFFNKFTYQRVYWDELSFVMNQNSSDPEVDEYGESAFKHLFANPALKLAFYSILLLSVVFIILASRRYQPAIRVVEEPVNSSISFSKTIARLYWLNPNHKKMAEKKMKFFLSEVRMRYGLDTRIMNEEFREQFRRKSGINERQINRLFDAFTIVTRSQTIHADLLQQISDSITFIRQQWK